jgi:hypothetical protein
MEEEKFAQRAAAKRTRTFYIGMALNRYQVKWGWNILRNNDGGTKGRRITKPSILCSLKTTKAKRQGELYNSKVTSSLPKRPTKESGFCSQKQSSELGAFYFDHNFQHKIWFRYI